MRTKNYYLALLLLFTVIVVLSPTGSAEEHRKAENEVQYLWIGDIITFGAYEQDNKLENGKESLEWLVLDVQDGRALLLSRYGIECMPFQKEGELVSWDNSFIRTWLNGFFLENTFSVMERARILETENVVSFIPFLGKSDAGTDTIDSVFLLSLKEYWKYGMHSGNCQDCQVTEYCYAQGAEIDKDGSCPWWLRSAGYYGEGWISVIMKGAEGIKEPNDIHTVVRPAMWIRIDSAITGYSDSNHVIHCPFCGEMIQIEQVACPWCENDLTVFNENLVRQQIEKVSDAIDSYYSEDKFLTYGEFQTLLRNWSDNVIPLENYYTASSALRINDCDISPAELTMYYAEAYTLFVDTYGEYASLFGLDTQYGLSGLGSQQSSMGEGTWKDYFLTQALNALKQNQALGKYAAENGIELTDEEKQTLEDSFANLEETAKSYGYGSADKFIAANYGIGNNVKTMKKYAAEMELASKVYNQVAEEKSEEVTLDEIKEQYPTVAVRHILVKAEAAEDGTYTDGAKEAAEAKAEEILKEWEEGDKTEESFAALAEQHSEDTGSNTNGGLYDSVMKGQMVEEFDAFCFDENRKPGDTGIVYGESRSYAGYHVMYFVGEGDPANNETGRSYIASEKMSEWLTSLTENIEIVYNCFYKISGFTTYDYYPT